MSENKGIIPALDYATGEAQPLSDEKREFVESVYALYEQFRSANRAYRDEIVYARQFCALQDPDADANTTQLNTLNSTIDNMLADYRDNRPEAIALPERVELSGQADAVTDLQRWMMHHANGYKAWDHAVEDATKTGTGVLQPYWDEDAEAGDEGNGMVQVLYWPCENWMPDPAYDDFQDGRAVFKVAAHPLSYFVQQWPEESRYIAGDAVARLEPDAIRDQSDSRYYDPLVALLEVWYRRWDADEKRYKIHMCKLAGGALLYDSRDDYPDGVYAHGRYPFVTLRFRERRDTAYGTGMVYEFGGTQRMINRFMRYIDENARASSRPKLLIARQANIDKVAATDYEKQVVEMDQVRADMMQWFQAAPMNTLVPSMVAKLQDMEKQDSGQNQFSRGEGGLGVTAASAISMLQEAGGKIARMHMASFNDSFRELCEQMLLLASEFFDETRVLLITGEEGMRETRRALEVDGRMLRGGDDRLLSNLPFKIRVQVQASAPSQVQMGNNAVMEVLNIAAQSGTQLSPSMLVRLLRGIPNKDELVQVLDQSDAMVQQIQQLTQMVQEMQGQLEQAGQAMQAQQEEIDAARQIIGDLGGGQSQGNPQGAPQRDMQQMPAYGQQQYGQGQYGQQTF